MPFAASMSRQFSPSQDWSRYNRLSLWCYLHPTTNPVSTLSIQFLCDGASAGPTDPVAIHYISDLTPGEWNQLTWEIPEMARDRVSRLVIFQPLFGLPVAAADPHLTYDFDELCLERSLRLIRGAARSRRQPAARSCGTGRWISPPLPPR